MSEIENKVESRRLRHGLIMNEIAGDAKVKN